MSQPEKSKRLPDTEIRAVHFNPPLYLDNRPWNVIDLEVEKGIRVSLDFGRREIWVTKLNTAGFVATSFTTFEQLAGVVYKVAKKEEITPGGPGGDIQRAERAMIG